MDLKVHSSNFLLFCTDNNQKLTTGIKMKWLVLIMIKEIEQKKKDPAPKMT